MILRTTAATKPSVCPAQRSVSHRCAATTAGRRRDGAQGDPLQPQQVAGRRVDSIHAGQVHQPLGVDRFGPVMVKAGIGGHLLVLLLAPAGECNQLRWV